jgi:ribosomal protein S18 acetylase RimI-like enzyme
MEIRVERVSEKSTADFFKFQCPENGNGWCHCVAWWTPTWEGWGERSAEQNKALREELFARGEYDGYLLYLDGKVSGWCQAGLRDRLEKLVTQFKLAPDPEVWAITCFELAPQARAQGHAREMLKRVLVDLRARGAKRVQAFPRKGKNLEPGDAWTGPEALYSGAGFRELVTGDKRLVVELRL